MTRPLLFACLLSLVACKREAPAPQSAPAASTSAASKPVVASKPPPPVKPPETRPPLVAKVSAAGEPRRAAAAAKLEKLYAAIEELANAPPTPCAASEPGCRKRFEMFASELSRLRKDAAAATVPQCPKHDADDAAIAQMAARQINWLSRWIDDIEAIGRPGFVDGDSAWDELKVAGEKQYPRVVPSCAQ